jgi:hypothetical protein
MNGLDRTYTIPVSNGVLEKKHREQIGAAVWVFLWLIDRTTDEEEGQGRVLHGDPLPFARIAESLGEDERTIKRHIDRLEKYNYVVRINHGAGKPWGYIVLKSKKWKNRTPNKSVRGPLTEVVKTPDKSVTPNKEDLTYLTDTKEGAEASSAPSIIGLPLNTGKEYQVTPKDLTEWRSLYPGIDVTQQLRNMRGWLLSNPARRKTPNGIHRFVTGWLSRQQDRNPKKPSGYSGPTLDERVQAARGPIQ